VEKFLRNFGYSKLMINNVAPIFFTGALQCIAEEILKLSCNYTNEKNNFSKKHKRITVRDIELAIRNHYNLNYFFTEYNIFLLGGGVVPYIHPKLLIKKINKKKKNSQNDEKKKHRFRPGTVSIREIKKLQKNINLTLAKFPFEKYIRFIFDKLSNKENLKISKEVFTILQYYIEQKIVDLLKKSNYLALHANRVKLLPSDVNLMINIEKNINPFLQNNSLLDINNEKEDEIIEDDDLTDDEQELDILEECDSET